jgi:hypothetical protein
MQMVFDSLVHEGCRCGCLLSLLVRFETAKQRQGDVVIASIVKTLGWLFHRLAKVRDR